MPADRLSFILADCEITHIISSDALSDTLNILGEKHDLNVYGIDVDSVHRGISWSDIA